MPLHYCHLTAPHKKLRVPEWYVSGLMMERALDAVVRRVKKLDREHDTLAFTQFPHPGRTLVRECADCQLSMPSEFRERQVLARRKPNKFDVVAQLPFTAIRE